MKECTKVHKIFETANFLALFLFPTLRNIPQPRLSAGEYLCIIIASDYLVKYIKLSSCAMSWRCICSGEKSAKAMVIMRLFASS